MKKMCMAFAAIMAAATVILLSSCGVGEPKNLSERRSGYFTATDGRYELTAISGVRETDYAADGVAGELKAYTLITLAPTDKSAFDIDASYAYEATVSVEDSMNVTEKKFGGAMIMHPFAASYSAEFDYETTAAFTVKITVGTETLEYELCSAVPENAIDCISAISAAKAELDPSGNYEIRARLIRNPVDAQNGLCWHVAFITDVDQTSSVLLDPVTARVIAVKKS